MSMNVFKARGLRLWVHGVCFFPSKIGTSILGILKAAGSSTTWLVWTSLSPWERALGSFVGLHGKTSKIRLMDQSWSKGLHLSDAFLSVPLPWSMVLGFGSEKAMKEAGVKQPVDFCLLDEWEVFSVVGWTFWSFNSWSATWSPQWEGPGDRCSQNLSKCLILS